MGASVVVARQISLSVGEARKPFVAADPPPPPPDPMR